MISAVGMTLLREVSGEQAAEPQVIVNRTESNLDKPAPRPSWQEMCTHPLLYDICPGRYKSDVEEARHHLVSLGRQKRGSS
jgi:hypothetical protein